jgi:hypothetical protein
MKAQNLIFLVIAAVLGYALLSGGNGGSLFQEQSSTQEDPLWQKYDALGDRLAEGSMPNVQIIRQLAQDVTQQKPELAAIAARLEKQATPDAARYQTLAGRIEQVITNTSGLVDGSGQMGQSMAERQRLLNIMNPTVYNDTLLDVANALHLLAGKPGAVQGVPYMADRAGLPALHVLAGDMTYGNWACVEQDCRWNWATDFHAFNSTPEIMASQWGQKKQPTVVTDMLAPYIESADVIAVLEGVKQGRAADPTYYQTVINAAKALPSAAIFGGDMEQKIARLIPEGQPLPTSSTSSQTAHHSGGMGGFFMGMMLGSLMNNFMGSRSAQAYSAQTRTQAADIRRRSPMLSRSRGKASGTGTPRYRSSSSRSGGFGGSFGK